MGAGTLGWFIAGICFTGLIVLWFSVSYRELTAKRLSLETIGQQVKLHRSLCMQERGGDNDAAAQKVLSGKLIAYSEAEKEYNALLKKPMNRVPALLFGFARVGKGASYDVYL